MKKIFFALLALSLTLVSCNKEETVILNQSGTLTIKVVDSDGKPVAGARVGLYEGYYYNDGLVFDKKTNASGICNTDKLIQGTYRAYAEIKIGDKDYRANKIVQVIADKNKTIELKLSLDNGPIYPPIIID